MGVGVGVGREGGRGRVASGAAEASRGGKRRGPTGGASGTPLPPTEQWATAGRVPEVEFHCPANPDSFAVTATAAAATAVRVAMLAHVAVRSCCRRCSRRTGLCQGCAGLARAPSDSEEWSLREEAFIVSPQKDPGGGGA